MIEAASDMGISRFARSLSLVRQAIAVAGGEAPLTQKSYMRPMLMRHTDCSTSTVVGLVDLRLE